MTDAVHEYELSFAKWLGVRNAYSFWKGRVALYAILKAAGVGPGDEVILPGYTCVVDVNPIKYLGAKPIYVDIEPQTYNINPALIEDKTTGKTRLIIAQHTYGYPCDMGAIMQIAQKHGLTVVEDCCLAFGSEYKGKMVGTFGKAAYFSFQWNKLFTTGVGGMVITNDREFAQRIEAISDQEMCAPSKKEIIMLVVQLAAYKLFIYPRTTALAQSLFRALVKKGLVLGSSKYDEYSAAPKEPDFFKGMSDLQACIGMKELRRVDKNIPHRKKFADLYDELFSGKGWPFQSYDKSLIAPVLTRYPVRIAEKEKALAEAAKGGVELGDWFNSPLHQIETSLEQYDYMPGMCPQAEKAAREVVNLPLHRRVKEITARKSVDFITEFTPVII